MNPYNKSSGDANANELKPCRWPVCCRFYTGSNKTIDNWRSVTIEILQTIKILKIISNY